MTVGHACGSIMKCHIREIRGALAAQMAGRRPSAWGAAFSLSSEKAGARGDLLAPFRRSGARNLPVHQAITPGFDLGA